MFFRTTTAVLMSLACATVQAQSYPNKTVRIIVTSSPGGSQDFLGRLVAENLHQALGQPFIVENKTGAGGNIAREYVAKSAADGYTLMTSTNGLSINHAMYETLPFDAIKSFAPIILIAFDKSAVGASTAFAPGSLAEMLAYARQHPGAVRYASCGTGTLQHLSAELLQAVAKVKLLHVPYKGCPPALPDTLSGQVDLIFTGVMPLIPHFKSGKIKPLAVIGAKRSSFAPDVAATAELGLPEVDVDGWFGLLAPVGTPANIIGKLNQSVNAMLAAPAVKAKMAQAYLDPIGGSPEQFAATIRREVTVFSRIIKEANIRPE